jgi:cell division protease FtsH
MMGGMAGGGAGMGVLSRLLTVMDGVTEISKRDEIQNRIRTWFGIPTIEQGVVLFIGATNRPDVLDSALVRPGRFDRRISIGKPDKHTRRALFEGYLKKVKHAPMNIEELVADTDGVSHAFIASAIEKDAARLAIFDGRKEITQRDIERSIEENIVGMANPVKDMMPDQKLEVAIHEAGHALMMHLVRPGKRIAGASIIRRSGGILGYVRDVERDEIFARPLAAYTADIMVSLAGHEAVVLVLGQPWTGATSDFRQVQTRLHALAMHGYFAGGMIPFDVNNPFEHKEIKESADKFAHECREKTQELLATHRATLDVLTNALLEKDELTSSELYDILNTRTTEGYVQ